VTLPPFSLWDTQKTKDRGKAVFAFFPIFFPPLFSFQVRKDGDSACLFPVGGKRRGTSDGFLFFSLCFFLRDPSKSKEPCNFFFFLSWLRWEGRGALLLLLFFFSFFSAPPSLPPSLAADKGKRYWRALVFPFSWADGRMGKTLTKGLFLFPFDFLFPPLNRGTDRDDPPSSFPTCSLFSPPPFPFFLAAVVEGRGKSDDFLFFFPWGLPLPPSVSWAVERKVERGRGGVFLAPPPPPFLWTLPPLSFREPISIF